MPDAYQYLRVRLRVEQTRLLNWGEKVGIVEDCFEEPSRSLHFDRNLVLDVLLEIQTLFKSCVKILEKYDPIVPSKQIPSNADVSSDRRYPPGSKSVLMKVLSLTEKTPQLGRRLQWAVVKQDAFKSNVEKLIGYNDAIEALLDSRSVNELQAMQRQTYMVMLQLNNKVDELRQMSLAMHIQTQPLAQPTTHSLSRATTLVTERKEENSMLASLADFKARQGLVEQEGETVYAELIKRHDLTFQPSSSDQSVGFYKGTPVWLEWKTYAIDDRYPSWWEDMIEHRVKQLVTLLASRDKPKQFRAPQCLGYFYRQSEEQQQYGLVYEMPFKVPKAMPLSAPISLLELMRTTKAPSLTKRKDLAASICQSLMYLHSVNWLHKGVRSSNLFFFVSEGEKIAFSEPVLSGFGYARPDTSGEATEPSPKYSNDDIYKHPESMNSGASRSKKSYDIYSLGVILAEIAQWKTIYEIFPLPTDIKAARGAVKRVKEFLLTSEFLATTEAAAGEVYTEAMRKCLLGGEELGLYTNADETDPEVGAAMLERYSREVVAKIGDIQL